MLGILSTESFSAQRFTNIRQKVFYFYPNGAAPLTGLLSLLKEEETNDPEYSGYEKRMSEQRTTTVAGAGPKGPFRNSADDASAGDTFTFTADTTYTVCVADESLFRTGHQVKFSCVITGGATVDLLGIVTAQPVAASGKIKVRALNTSTATVINAAGENVGKEAWVVGSAYSQGSRSNNEEIYNLPVNYGNYCQIFKTPFLLTGSAVKTTAKYDESGPYKDKAKEHSVTHMIELEKAFLFSVKRKYVNADGLPTYTTDGILQYLRAWEAGTLYGNSAATLDADDNKRIITNSTGNMNIKLYEKYLERLFRVTNNVSNEKLCLCGSGFLLTINQMYRGQGVLTYKQGSKETFGLEVVSHTTAFGTVHYKSHPLFSQNPTLRFNGLFLDVPNLRYRPLAGRDTELLKNRQENDADYRKDEWLTEAGLEVSFPESHMYMQNVINYVP